MKLVHLSLFALFALSACTSEGVRQSISTSLRNSCKNASEHCTVYDAGAPLRETEVKR